MAGEGGSNRRLVAARRALGLTQTEVARTYPPGLHTATVPHTKNSDIAEPRHNISKLIQVSA
ncbi:MAG: hypothetical protein QOH50_2159 [Kribbellaceae bacterium]|jgi:hypothetical protein|nr:hypothetical protein [Kribbellaceae bacterium]